uniref:Uncharacterized protein n=1 Tax=Oryza sativa subsp. japonica TaxID=39947 RepID=Q6K5S8_ORYSJ|nr:hypothetical protein [Oryza sativa Japonica Group]BAD22047.1 hypothetical protein [Oryza sativa Japonica Group]
MAAPIPTLFPQPQATTAANASEGPLLSPPSATKAPSSNGRHHVLAESEAGGFGQRLAAVTGFPSLPYAYEEDNWIS